MKQSSNLKSLKPNASYGSHWWPMFSLLMGWINVTTAWAGDDIWVLRSHDSPPYQQALAGFQSVLNPLKLDVRYTIETLPNGLEALKGKGQPELVFTLGTPATKVALAQINAVPLVAGLVLDTEDITSHANATGVSLDFPAALQWQWLRRLLPAARNIAVIYDSRSGRPLFQALQQAANADEVTLLSAPISNAEDFPQLLQNLPSQLDAIWVADGTAAYTAAAVRELLLYSFRNRTPLIGLSSQWVKAGALYALDWDYRDLGVQAGELAAAILFKKQTPKNLPLLTPRQVRPVLNLKTAEHMKLDIPERWLQEMAEVYR